MVWKASVAYRHCKPGSAAIFDHNAPSLDGYETASSTTSSVNHLKSISQSGIAASSSKDDKSSQASKLEGLHPQKGPSKMPEYPCNGKSAQPVNEQIIDQNLPLKNDTDLEWVAQVEPGVLITFLALPDGGNELKRIRFSREMFNKWQAEAWWTANSDRVHALYNVRVKDKPASLPYPLSSKEVARSFHEIGDSANSPDVVSEQMIKPNHIPDLDAIGSSAHVASSDSEGSTGSEWVAEDEPGIFITVNALPGGIKTLKRVRFSCDRFNEQQAKLWWEKNRFRVHEQYLRKHMPGASFTSI
ncbi:hypothetical protein O6H91_23G033400 [Diphasiastrum complanatum]|nr:hypothetical protein O6H91_23G033400 [Diphasiastrum complanatum]